MMTEKESFIQQLEKMSEEDLYELIKIKKEMRQAKEYQDSISLKKDNIIRIGIKDSEGNDTGKYISFDLEDITLPLRLSDCEELHKKNIVNLRDKFIIIEKKEDKKGKKILSWKEEEKLKALEEYYRQEMKALDMFIGEGKTQMLLDLMGRNPYYSMYDDISEMLNPILPKLKMNADSIKKQIIQKYSSNNDSEVLK